MISLLVLGAFFAIASQNSEKQTRKDSESSAVVQQSVEHVDVRKAGGVLGEGERWTDRISEAIASRKSEASSPVGPEEESSRSASEDIEFPNYAERDQVTLHFRSQEELLAFIERARKQGTRIRGVLAELNAVQVSLVGDQTDAELLGLAGDSAEVAFNFPVFAPTPPAAEGESGNSGFADSTLDWLGVPENNSDWGEGIKVAVLDTALVESEALRNSLVDTVRLVDQASGEEPLSHGTAVASLISSSDPQARGIAPAADLLSIAVLDSNGSSSSFTVAQGILEAVDRGAQIVSLSLGSFGDSRVLREAVRYAASKDVVLVAAAGNDSLQQVPYPARYDEVLAVTAVDSRSRRASFSNVGPEIDLGAPGVQVRALRGDNKYIAASGTSFAAPIVSGMLAAIMSFDSSVSPQNAVDALLSYTDDVGLPGQDPIFGSGILNARRILERGQAGIYDIAIADQVLYTAGTSDGRIPLIVTVQNRGTEVVSSINLEVKVVTRAQTFQLGKLAAGEVASATIEIRLDELATLGSLPVQSRVLSNVDDNPENDARATVFRLR